MVHIHANGLVRDNLDDSGDAHANTTLPQLKQLIMQLLQPGETVCSSLPSTRRFTSAVQVTKGLKRLSAASRKPPRKAARKSVRSRSPERGHSKKPARGRSPSPEADDEYAKDMAEMAEMERLKIKAQFDELTEAADLLLSRGIDNVYQLTVKDLVHETGEVYLTDAQKDAKAWRHCDLSANQGQEQIANATGAVPRPPLPRAAPQQSFPSNPWSMLYDQYHRPYYYNAQTQQTQWQQPQWQPPGMNDEPL